MSGICLGPRSWPPGYRTCSSGRPASPLASGQHPHRTADLAGPWHRRFTGRGLRLVTGFAPAGSQA